MFNSRSFILLGKNGEFMRGATGDIWHWDRKFEAKTWEDGYWKACQNCQVPNYAESSEELKKFWGKL